jgi:tetrahydromethanopterin S-methyltransferase subunit H
MFVFKIAQKTYDLGKIRIGGQPGENPPALVGGLFFKGQEVVKDSNAGLFDEDLALQWINTQDEMSALTGLSSMIQLFAATPQAMENHMLWLADKWEGVFTFESINPEARACGIRLAKELGLEGRTILNSINLSTSKEELEIIKASGLKTAIALGWNPGSQNIGDRLETIKSMIAIASETGVQNIIVDPAVLPIKIGYGLDWRTNVAVKAELGYPISSGAHNVPGSWTYLKQFGKDETARLPAVIAALVASRMASSDMIMYGSMKRSRDAFTALTLIENGISKASEEAMKALGKEPCVFTPKI